MLIFNIIIMWKYVKVKKNTDFYHNRGMDMKIYDYHGKKNLAGGRIREARLKLRLSQADLAARMQVEGVPIERDSISRIEIGTRFIPDYELPLFSKVLGVSVEWLLGMDG